MEISMRKLILVTTAALTLGAASAPAQARDGAAVAAGFIGGLAGGLAAAAAQPVYRPAYYPADYPEYRRPVYYRAADPCWLQRQRSVDDFGNVYFRRVRVCG
jgi:hypothetical protein